MTIMEINRDNSNGFHGFSEAEIHAAFQNSSWTSCCLELVRDVGCPPPPASCDCSMELGQVGSYQLQSPVASKRATLPPSNPSDPVSDKINPGRRCEQQQEEFHGFTDLDVSAASEKADVLRKEGDLLKHDLAEARAHKANHEEDVKQRSATEGVQALSVAKSELVTKDAEGESEMRPEKAKPETVVIRKLPKSTTSSESGGSGKSRVSGVPKKKKWKDKSMLNNFKDFLHSKLKKHEKRKGKGDDVFHGFSDDEIRSASANDSSSERSSIISSLSREEKDERKRRKAAALAARASSGMSGEPSVPLLHQSLIVEGKRPKKPSAKIQELTQIRKARSKSLDCQSEKKAKPRKEADVSKQEVKDVKAETEAKNASPEDGLQKTVKLYANTITEGGQGNQDELKKIETILQSGWKKEKKSKSNATPQTGESSKTKPLLKESVLEVAATTELPILHELHDPALKALRKDGGIDRLCGQVQACLRGTSTKMPQLVRHPEKGWTNPTGAALTQLEQKQGNLVCGVCGALQFSEDVSKQLKFGTHLCTTCSTFITPLISRKTTSIECKESKGLCLVLPSNKESCPACWLLLFLLGCEFPKKVFTKLDALLPSSLRSHPDSSPGAVVNAGKVLFCTQRILLDRSLVEKTENSVSSSSATSDEILGHFSSKNERRSVVHETLPNNWTKKAVRRVKGALVGKWDVFLITPDKQVLRSQQQLKLFTAKTGAVIDANIVNFKLPQQTFIMESQLKSLSGKTAIEESDDKKATKTKSLDIEQLTDLEDGNDEKGSVHSAVSSKRSHKTPKKFEDYQPQKKTPKTASIEAKKKTPLTIHQEAQVDPDQKGSPGKYKCDECEKEFKKKSHLDEHILIHAGEKPFPCEKCGWGFRRSDKMRKHMESCNYVNRESEYAAFLRPEKRRSSEGMRTPMTASTTSSRWTQGVFICEVCKKDCGYRQNLYIHMKKHEKNGEWTRPETGPMFPKLVELTRSRSASPPTTDEVPVKRGRGRPKRVVEDSSPSVNKTGSLVAAKSTRRFSAPPIRDDLEESQLDNVEKADEQSPKEQRTKWRGGAPPSYWVWGRYICELCKKDCGYANNLGLHRKRSHGLSYRQEKLGYNGEIERGSKIKQNPNEPGYGTSKRKRKREKDEQSEGGRFVTKAMPCFECVACKSDDCMECKWCHDKKKHGGPGRLNKRCIKRRCTQPKIVEMMDHMPSRPMKMVRLEGGGTSRIHYTTTPIRTTYLQAGGLVKAMPCRSCSACLMEDCGSCRYCLDKRKFGGPGRMNKRCREKQCLTPKEFGSPSTVPTNYVRKMPEYVSSKFLDDGETPRRARDPKDTNTSYDEEDDEDKKSKKEDQGPIPQDLKFSLESFISMGLEPGGVTPEYLSSIQMEEFGKDRARGGSSPKKAIKTIPVNVEKLSPSKCNVAVDFFEPFDKEEISVNGVGIISSEKGTEKDLCFICGTSGGGKMLYCIACCEPHHPFCLEQEDLPNSDLEEQAWVCNRCSVCKVCGGGAQGEEGERCCDICRHLFHAGCLPPDQKEMTGDSWSCGLCRQCAGCGSGTVVHVSEGEALCSKCCRSRLRGSYCPACKGCYQENDYEQAMMECGVCGGWIHAKCEGLDGEEYQVLSLLPDSVEYVCKECLPAGCQAAGWRKAVQEEIRRGQNQVVQSLLLHPNASLFTFQREEAQLSDETKDSKELHIPNSVDKEEAGKNEMINEDPISPSEIKKNLFEEKTSPTLLFASGTFTKLLGPSIPKRKDSFTGESILSFSSSLPTSLTTDPPPTPLSVSSYGSMEKPTLPLESLGVSCLHPCQVSVRPLVLKAFPTNPIIQEDMEEDESLVSTESSCGTESLDSDDDCHIEEGSTKEELATHDEQYLDPDFALELNELKSIVEHRGCSSILQLYLNIQHIIKTWPLPEGKVEATRQELALYHRQVMEEVFPWFDLQEPSRHWTEWQPSDEKKLQDAESRLTPVKVGQKRKIEVTRPDCEHTYAKCPSVPEEKYKYDEEDRLSTEEGKEDDDEDCRRCFFCAEVGNSDINMAGRLLSLRFNEWVHVNCALWSSEVYETVDGSLQNVSSAASRCRTLLCSECSNRGATIGCCHKDCPSNFHFSCGVNAKADFKEDKTIYCIKHAQKYATKPNARSFHVDRTVWVDTDPEETVGRKRSKFVDFRELQFSLGSVTYDRLGSLVPASDTKSALVPVGLSARKTYWSVLNPARRTTYRCTTRLVSRIERRTEITENIVINHSEQSNEEIAAILDEFEKKIKEAEYEEKKDEVLLEELMAPDNVSKVWPWLSLKELKNRPIKMPPSQKQPPCLTPQKPTYLMANSRSPRAKTHPSPQKFNRAVSTFRTPKKATDQLLEDDFDLLDFCDSSDVNLINDILQSSDFNMELDSFREEREKELKIVRSWFNANKKFKVREVMTQTTQYYDGVQIASDNVYTQFKQPSPDKDRRKQTMCYMRQEQPVRVVPIPGNHYEASQNGIFPQMAFKENIPLQVAEPPSQSLNTQVKRQFFTGQGGSRGYSYKVDPRHRLEVQGRSHCEPSSSTVAMSYHPEQEQIIQMFGQAQPQQGSRPDTIPQFDGLGEDDIIKLLEDSDDDVVKIEADSSEDEDQAVVDQLDGAAEDQKRDEVDKKPDLPPPGQIVTKPKEEDVKFEALPIPPSGPILLHSTLGHSQASPGSSRGPTPARTPVTPHLMEGDISPSIADHPVLCSDCGNSYGSKRSYDAHLSGCAAMVRLMERREEGGEKQKEEVTGEKQKEKIVVEPEAGSPRKDFSIMGLLTKEEVKEEVKPSVEDDDIMIVSENIIKQPVKPPSAKRAIMRPPSQPRSTMQTSVPYSTTTSSPYGQYTGAPLQPQLAQTYPYGSTVIQYPYGYSPGMLGVPAVGLPTLHSSPMMGGYITLPGVQPVLQQPIYYNPQIGGYSMRPQMAPHSFLAPALPQGYAAQPGQPQQLQQSQPQLSSVQPQLQQSQPQAPQLQPQIHMQQSQSQLQMPQLAPSQVTQAQVQAAHSQAMQYSYPNVSQPSRPSSVIRSNEQPPRLSPIVSSAPSQPPFSSQSVVAPPPRKIARVQPTPHIVRPIPTKATQAPPPAHRFQGVQLPSPSPTHTAKTPTISPAHKQDPMLALNSLSKNPMAQQELATDLSISHRNPSSQIRSLPVPTSRPSPSTQHHHLVPASSLPSYLAPTSSSLRLSPKHEVIELDSKPSSPALSDHGYSISSPEPDTMTRKGMLDGVHVTTKSSKTNSIKMVLQRDKTDKYNITEMMIRDGSMANSSINPKTAMQALKTKTKVARKQRLKESFRVPLDRQGSFHHAQYTFVNEVEAGDEIIDRESGPPVYGKSEPSSSNGTDKKGPHIMFNLFSEDGGFSAESSDITALWRMVFDAVSAARASQKMATGPTTLVPSGEEMLGLTHSALRYLLEQFPGARKATTYEWKHQEPPPPPEVVKENPTGSARSEPYRGRKDRDMFAWLASRHRKMPHPNVGFKLPPELAAEAHLMGTSQRRATSLDLPMAMRFRHLAKNAKEAVGVYCSGIHGVGLFCKREIQGGEMVIEYAGEEIRAMLTDNREKFYDGNG